jgi:molybdate/tungstate transport system substrate-binding protein
MALALASCGAPSSTGKAHPAQRGDVDVLYAGSLVDVMENAVAPQFHKATGYTFEGVAAGSQALAHEITGHLRQGDVFISASPSVDASLMGSAGGDYLTWYVTFAKAPLVIGYNPQSRFAQQLRRGPWYVVLQQPGLRLGRTDPQLDPKGALTVDVVQKAQTYYHRPGLVQHILGTPENASQVFPEEDLVGRLQSGQLDAGFFYSNEAVQAHIPYIALPKGLEVSATFTVSVLRGAQHPKAAVAFVRFLLSPQGSAILRKDGLLVVFPTVRGQAQDLPKDLAALMIGR